MLTKLQEDYQHDKMKFYIVQRSKIFVENLLQQDFDYHLNQFFFILRGKRQRYTILEEQEPTFTDINNFISNCVSGNARYKALITSLEESLIEERTSDL